jgi:hypothetical protein
VQRFVTSVKKKNGFHTAEKVAYLSIPFQMLFGKPTAG